MTEVIAENEAVDIEGMSRALTRGSEVAYRAVMKPVEGTILTVVREASEEGQRSKDGKTSMDEWFTGVVLKARETLEHTPELLPVLKDAGVVDAGGRGLLAIFEGMLAYLTGEELQAIEEEVSLAVALERPQVEAPVGVHGRARRPEALARQRGQRLLHRRMLDGARHERAAARAGPAGDAVDRQMVGFGRAAREHHLRGLRPDQRGHLLARLLDRGARAGALGVGAARIAEQVA